MLVVIVFCYYPRAHYHSTATASHVISCHVMSSHVISCHLVVFLFLPQWRSASGSCSFGPIPSLTFTIRCVPVD